MDVTLSLSGGQHAALCKHLFAGDGKEAAAIVLCGRHAGKNCTRLLAQRIHLIPHDACTERTPQSIVWPTDLIIPWLDEADRLGLSVVKVHSHPGYWPRFSDQDDRSDSDLFPCIDGWISADVPHASVVMLPDGRMFGRTVSANGSFAELKVIAVAGDDMLFWRPRDFDESSPVDLPHFTARHAKAFGARTTMALRDLSVAVVGCSGTGSPTIAQLTHLGVGRLVLVDQDRVLEPNLNRIIFATMSDAKAQRFKVHVMAEAVERAGLDTVVERYATNLYTPEAVNAVASCDVLFGCVDSAEGRFLLNLISSFYVLPYIDIGVTLEADKDGELTQVCGYLHYIQPGGSSLLSRGAISMEDVQAEGIRRQNLSFYEEQRRAGYIKGVREERPAVVSVNTQFSGLAVTELIARMHGFREKPNREYAKVGLSLSDLAFYPEAEPSEPCRFMSRQVGRGDIVPLLNLPELSGGPT